MTVMDFDFDENKTYIVMNRKKHQATIITSDSKMMNRMDKLYGDECMTKVFTKKDKALAKEFIIDDRMVTFRSKLPEPKPLSDEERERRRQLMKAIREKWLAEKKGGC